MKKQEIITYNKLMEKLKDIPLEKMTSLDIFNRYIIYGTIEELNTPKIQILVIRYGYVEYLVNKLKKIKTNETVITEMLKSESFKRNYTIKRGIVKNIEISKLEEFSNTFNRAYIELLDTTNKEKCLIEYVDNENNINNLFKKTYIEKYVIVVVQNMETVNRLCCFLITNRDK